MGTIAAHAARRVSRLAATLALLLGCTGNPADGVIATGRLHAHTTTQGRLTTHSSDLQLWYERSGDAAAPAVVLINGNDAQAIFWPEDFVADLLDAGYQVVRYDGRDAGLSEWQPFPESFEPETWTPEHPPPYPLAAHVVDLWGLLDGLGLDRAHLVGISQGGMVAQLAALDAPDRVSSLALISTSPSSPYDAELGAVDPDLLAYLRDQYPKVGRAAATAWFGCGRVVELQTDLFVAMSGVRPTQRPPIRDYVEATCARAGINARSSQGFAVASAKSRIEALKTIRIPTLVLHGNADLFFRPTHAEALAGAIPGAKLVWVEAGHGFPVAAFTDHVEAMLDNFERSGR